jgi:uncharacterized protein (TIGR02246 family)
MALVALAAVSLLPACRVTLTRGTDSPADVTTVQALFMSGIAAFNRHAIDEFTAQFADDIRMYTPTGWATGRPAVVERFRGTFAQFPKVRMEIDSLVVQSVGADVATVAFRWRVFPMGQGPAFHGVGSGVYVRRDGRWVEVLEHETVTKVDAELSGPPRSQDD